MIHQPHSAIGRTNMLKQVTNSLGGRFTLDYEHTAPTYGLPGGKWVMSSVTVDDGIHDDGPLMMTRFAYSDGMKDRHEREFLGFGKVISKSIDTEKATQSFIVRQYNSMTCLLTIHKVTNSVRPWKMVKVTSISRHATSMMAITSLPMVTTTPSERKLPALQRPWFSLCAAPLYRNDTIRR